jgi:hypothetical protein
MSKAPSIANRSENVPISPTPCWKKTVLGLVALVAIAAIFAGSLALHNPTLNLGIFDLKALGAAGAIICVTAGGWVLAMIIGGTLYFSYRKPQTTEPGVATADALCPCSRSQDLQPKRR